MSDTIISYCIESGELTLVLTFDQWISPLLALSVEI